MPIATNPTLIQPGGKVINKIIADTGVEKIDIQDDGNVFITSLDGESGEKAREIVEAIVKVAKVGEVYTGTVTRIIPIGAFVQILPGKEGLVHISKLDTKRVENVEDVVSVGDQIEVKIVEIDAQGRINLSRKALLPGGEEGGGDDRGHRGGGGPRGGGGGFRERSHGGPPRSHDAPRANDAPRGNDAPSAEEGGLPQRPRRRRPGRD